jgi:hypothetical protein
MTVPAGMMLVSAEKIQTMQRGYEDRIKRQREIITRLGGNAEEIGPLVENLRTILAMPGKDTPQVLVAAIRSINAAADQIARLRLDIERLTRRLNAVPQEQPDDPVVWSRRIPDDRGPQESHSDETVAFDAWQEPVGEERPAKSL